ncbi:MAG: tetratricopeptide repeat protein, partial [Chitinophagaceae bacterium]
MYRVLIFILSSLAVGAKWGHAQKLFGYVVEQNSGSKPVPGVMVKARLANQTATTEKGTFTLTFQNAKPGDNAVLVIDKDDWVIVEKSRLIVNLPADPFSYPHTVVICKADAWAKANQANYQLLNKTVREALLKQKSQLNKQSVNYQQTIDSLEDQFIKTQQHLGELTDALSRVNLDDVSETEKAAYAYFAEGKIDEAVLLRSTMQSEKNFLLATRRFKELSNIPDRADSSIVNIRKVIDLHRRNLKEEISLAKLRLDWKTAEDKLKFLADNDNTEHENLLAYGEFLSDHNEFDKAQKVYEECLDVYRRLKTESPKAFGSNLANVLYQLGSVLKKKYQYKAAEEKFEEAFTLYTQLSKEENFVFNQEMAQTISALAAILGDKQLLRQAEAGFKQALNLVKPLQKTNKDIYNVSLAAIQADLALLYLNGGMYKTADSVYKLALNILRQNDSLNVLANQVAIAEIQNKLGYIYLLQNKNEAAEVVLQNALTACRKYQSTSPGIYDLLLANVMANLGMLYTRKANLGTYVVSKKDSALAKDFLEDSRHGILKLVNAAPDYYSPSLAAINEDLGFFFTEVNDRDSAEIFYAESVTIYERYAILVPGMFELRLAGVQRKLGTIYQWRSSIAASIMFNSALNIYRRYAADKPGEMEEQIAETLYAIAVNGDPSAQTYSEEENLGIQKKSLAQYKDVQAIYARLDKKSGGKFAKDLKNIAASIDQINKEIARIQTLDASIYTPKSDLEKAEYELTGVRYDIQEARTNYHKLILLRYLVQRKSELIRAGQYKNLISLGHDYNDLSWYLLLHRKFPEAEKAARSAIEPGFKKPSDYDKEIEYAKANLAVSLLLQDK